MLAGYTVKWSVTNMWGNKLLKKNYHAFKSVENDKTRGNDGLLK